MTWRDALTSSNATSGKKTTLPVLLISALGLTTLVLVLALFVTVQAQQRDMERRELELREVQAQVEGLGIEERRLRDEISRLGAQSLQAQTDARAAVEAEVVQEAIVTALEAHDRQRHHRLLGPTAAIKVLRQGSGRAVCGEALLRRLFVLLVRGELNTDTINALAMALSRRAEAPEALTRAQIDSLLPRLSAELLDLIRRRSFQVRFKNTLSAIAALFRWREQEPHALLATNEPAAAALQITLRQALDLLSRPEYQQVRALDQKIKLLKKIEEYLVGKGDPAILRLIEEAD